MRHIIAARLALCAAVFCGVASAAAPGRVDRIVVPYAAGGVTDLYGRVLAEKIAAAQGSPVVVENKPGGGAAIGTAHVANSPPDGRTILLGSVGTATNPAMISNLPYDPAAITPVAQVAVSPLVLYVRSGLPADVHKLIDYAKAEPGKMTFANSGAGSSPNLAAALFARETGIQVTHVNYRGTSAAITDFLGGRVDGYFDTLQAMEHVKTGRIQAVAVAAPQRLPQAPDIPTLDELGIPNVHASSWWGVFVPAQTPPGTIAALETRLREVVANPAVQKQALDMGAVAVFRDRQAFARFFGDEVKRWRAIIEAEKLSSH